MVVAFHKGFFIIIIIGYWKRENFSYISTVEQFGLEAKTPHLFLQFSPDVLANRLFSLSHCAELIY